MEIEESPIRDLTLEACKINFDKLVRFKDAYSSDQKSHKSYRLDEKNQFFA